VASAVLALIAAVPAAFATVVPADDTYGPPPAAPGTTVRVITAGGTPGWQIILIAVAAALVAATAAVLLDRTRTSRQSASPPVDAPARLLPGTSRAWTIATVLARPRQSRQAHRKAPVACCHSARNIQICAPEVENAKPLAAAHSGGSARVRQEQD